MRGLVDTDGTVCTTKIYRRRRIVFYTTSEELSKQVCTLLNEFEIKNGICVNKRKYRNEKPVYQVYIYANSTDRFINLIKPLKAKTGWAGS